MHLGGAGIEDHLLDLARGRAAHDGVVDEDHPLALDQRAVDVELEAHAHVADLLGRLDEGAAHVLVADDAHGVGNAALVGVADGRGRAAVGHRADEVGLDRRLAGQLDADLAPGLVDRAAAEDRIGAREIDMLEDAEARASAGGRGEAIRRRSRRVMTTISPGSISRTNSAPMMSSAQVSERQHPAVADAAQHQRAHAQRIAHADQLGPGHRDDGERALDPAQRVLHPLGDVALERAGHQVDDAFADRTRTGRSSRARSARGAAHRRW